MDAPESVTRSRLQRPAPGIRFPVSELGYLTLCNSKRSISLPAFSLLRPQRISNIFLGNISKINTGERVYAGAETCFATRGLLGGVPNCTRMYGLKLQICVTGCHNPESVYVDRALISLYIFWPPVHPAMQHQTPKLPYAVQGREGRGAPTQSPKRQTKCQCPNHADCVPCGPGRLFTCFRFSSHFGGDIRPGDSDLVIDPVGRLLPRPSLYIFR